MTEEQIAQIAAITHEANAMWCRINGDESQAPWPQAPQWQKDSAIAGVRGIIEGKIRSPRESHESWMEHKRNTGWVFGEVKDEVAKTHPRMVDYDLLPPEQQKKDALFHGIIRALAGLPPAAS